MNVLIDSKILDNTGYAGRNMILLTSPLVLVIGWLIAVYYVEKSMTDTFFSNAAAIYTLLQTSLSALTLNLRVVALLSVSVMFHPR
jgi:hypothetical protein